MDAHKLVLILMIFTIGTGLAKISFSFPKFTRKISNVDVSKTINWSDYADSVLIKITRAVGDPIGNTVCTGVLIHQRMVLTTAHCADGAISMNVIFDVENGEFAKDQETVLKNNILMHPDYHREVSLYKNDLAVITLDQKNSVRKKVIRRVPTKYVTYSDEQMVRIGVGLRNGKNMRNITDPHFVKMKAEGVMETKDSYALVGDSGGPIYSPQHELLGIHSTMDSAPDSAPDSLDGLSDPHAYSAYLPYFKGWIDEQLKRVK